MRKATYLQTVIKHLLQIGKFLNRNEEKKDQKITLAYMHFNPNFSHANALSSQCKD